MNQIDVRESIVKCLKNGGFTVISNDVKEGFPKPAVFVTVSHSEHDKLMNGMEDVTDFIVLKYIPQTETIPECVSASNKILKLFYYNSFKIGNSIFMPEHIESDIDDYILTVSFEITYTQTIPEPVENEKMTEIEIKNFRVEE